MVDLAAKMVLINTAVDDQHCWKIRFPFTGASARGERPQLEWAVGVCDGRAFSLQHTRERVIERFTRFCESPLIT